MCTPYTTVVDPYEVGSACPNLLGVNNVDATPFRNILAVGSVRVRNRIVVGTQTTKMGTELPIL